LETNSFNLSTATARFVLSMNCEYHNLFFFCYNELICTDYSLHLACEQRVNNASQPMKSNASVFRIGELLTAFCTQKIRCEQVLFVTFQKKSRSTEKF